MNYSIIILSLFSFLVNSYGKPSESVFPLLMPKINPKDINEDDYLCTSYKLNSKESQYITEFKPNALDPIPIHHMLVYGCETPPDPPTKIDRKNLWKCMGEDWADCGPGHNQLLYSWSRNASTYTLPKGIGFKVGGDTKIKHLILHVHYYLVERIKEPDETGFLLKMIHESAHQITKRAGLITFFSGANDQKRAVIPAHSSLNFENACPINVSKELHLISVRPNTNSRGALVSSWLIRGNRGRAEWTLIGNWNPNPFQAFYPIDNKSLVVRPNDWLAMRCVAVNQMDDPVYYGLDDSEETCNQYIMYWTDAHQTPDIPICLSYGPLYYSWQTDPKLPGGSVPYWVNKVSSI